jgi:type II secretory pathway component PulF
MSEIWRQLLQDHSIFGVLAMFALYVLFGLLPFIGAVFAIYFLLTLPLRRSERARMFLDLLELGLKEGRTPEAAIADAASSRDASLGARFHLLAAHLRQGQRLTQALEHTPRLLPPQIAAMLKTGERIGDIAKVLPACRLLLKDSISNVRGALNYLILLSFTATPFATFVPLIVKLKVLPSFRAVFSGMIEGAPLPAFTAFVFEHNTGFIIAQVSLMGLIWLATLAYLGGPRLRGWIDDVVPGAADRIDQLLWCLPWRRKRLQRDFSAMLATLLEAGVPEAEAVGLAGASTANLVLRRRADKVRAMLSQGTNLPEAVRALDASGELRWRLANALQRRGGFVRALTGWHEALDAKAFQLEQSAAQLTTTVLVLLNGLVVACIFIGILLVLIQLINNMTVW